jgi:hypothetical protein
MATAKQVSRLVVAIAVPLFACGDTDNPTAPVRAGSPQAALASDASSIALLYPRGNSYWWDHTDITVAVRASSNTDPAIVAASRAAIVTWNTFLQDELDGLVTMTDVTGSSIASKADITLHYVPHAGGARFAGYAVCGAPNNCPNVLISSEFAQSTPYSPALMHDITVHELGHALGLGHAEPILTSSDVMAYGWYFNGFPYVMSACDVKALQAVFEWAVDGDAPHPPRVTAVQC